MNMQVQHYLQKAKEATNLADKVKFEVFADGLLHPTEDVLENTPKEQLIDTFHGTWLSNFYAVPVEMNGIIYPSVEHAYQAAKFDSVRIRNLSQSKQIIIREFLKEKGYASETSDLSTLFTNPTITSGIIKRVSVLLQEFGILEKEWDNRRVDIMINLLLQKYTNPEMAKRLVETSSKVLVEGNTWNDTYWGVSDDRGKNMLGRLLKNIRSKLQSGELQLKTE